VAWLETPSATFVEELIKVFVRRRARREAPS